MFPFKKKKNEEEESTIDELPVKKTRKRKKKEEPPKPWGKTERIIVFTILVGSLALSLFFAFKSKNIKITGNQFDTTSLKEDINNEIQDKNNSYGIWIQALDNSYKLGINENEEFNSAFFTKIALLEKYKEEVAKGNIDPNTPYIIKHVDTDLGVAGESLTYKDIAMLLENNFNNSAFSVLSQILNQYPEIKVEASVTPYNFGLLLFNHSSLLKNINTKSFTIDDAEITLASKPYILVILSKGNDEEESTLEIQKIRDIVYQSLGK